MSETKPRLPRRALISWRFEREEVSFITHTCGFVVAEDDHCYTIAHDYHDGFWSAASTVPKDKIVSINFTRERK